MLPTSFHSCLLLGQSFPHGTQLVLIAKNTHALLLQENLFFKNSDIILAREGERKC